MPTAAQVLGRFAAELRFEDIPSPVVERAKDCIADTIGIATFGAHTPWGRMAAEYALRYGAGGGCTLLGYPDERVHAPFAAFANGLFAHAFEHDNFRDPSAGAHPGPALMPAMLATCEETGADGKTAIAAFVAGCEVLFRIGVAAHKSGISPERRGFHAPGLTGPYGAAAAAGRVLGLSAEQMINALGIAGSLSAGILAFTHSRQGGNVKRLHLGRATESGLLAARLAASGYTGPETVLDGRFGFLEAYCHDGDVATLTGGVGRVWETQRIGLKRYPCHMSASTAVHAMRSLMQDYQFAGADVAGVIVEGAEKLAHHPHISEPGDVGQAQYSVPFCVALALFRDPDDPKSFDASAVADPAIREVCRNVIVRKGDRQWPSNWSTRVIVKLKDGRELVCNGDAVDGMLVKPFSRDLLRRKFLLVTDGMGEVNAHALFDRLTNLERERHFSLS